MVCWQPSKFCRKPPYHSQWLSLEILVFSQCTERNTMITEITSKGVETRNADKSEVHVQIPLLLKGLDIAAELEKTQGLAEAVMSLVAHVDSLSEKLRALEAEVLALKEDDVKDDKAVEELSKKLETVSAAKAKTAVSKKAD